jgi:hypothetical protein
MDDWNCAVCIRPVDLHARPGDPESGGYIPVPDSAIVIWVHHRCLETPRLAPRRSMLRPASTRDDRIVA